MMMMLRLLHLPRQFRRRLRNLVLVLVLVLVRLRVRLWWLLLLRMLL